MRITILFFQGKSIEQLSIIKSTNPLPLAVPQHKSCGDPTELARQPDLRYVGRWTVVRIHLDSASHISLNFLLPFPDSLP